MKNPDFVLEAVQTNGLVLRYASSILRTKKAIVLAAVRNNGLALQDANDELKNDPEVVHTAIAQNPDAAQFAGPDLQNDPLVLGALRSRARATASHVQNASCVIS